MRQVLTPLLLLLTAAVRAEVVDIREGTNLSLAIHPEGDFMVVDLLGGLWRLPVTGGAATALLPAGSGIAQPRFDASGEHIVYQRWLDEQWDIWVLTLATGDVEAVTTTEFNEREPDFSADGQQIVFASDRSGRYCLWSIDLQTRALRQLTDEAGEARFPSFDETGALAYVSVGGDRSEIRVHDGGLRGRTLIASSRRLDAPSWRPGSGVLVVNERDPGLSSDLRLYIDADEPIWRRLTLAEDVFVGRPGWLSAEEYVYAADGALWRRGIGSLERSRILLFAGVDVEPVPNPEFPVVSAGPYPVAGVNGFIRDPASGRATFSALGDLWLLQDDEIVRLTDDAATDRSPRFSPDGDWVIFASDRGEGMDVWQLRLASKQLLQLTDEAGAVFEPRPSEDGRFVAFLEASRDSQSQSARLRLVERDRPFQSTVLESTLYDAGGLNWQGPFLRLEARDQAGGTPYLHVYETDAAETRSPSVPDSDSVLPAANVLQWRRPDAGAAWVIQAARLFDGVRSEYQYHVDIHLEGRRIVDIVRRGRLPLPDRVVDVSESTVLPGFIDVHSHLSDSLAGDAGSKWLRHGITLVRDVTADWRRSVELAETWASGQQAGPRVLVAPLPRAGRVELPPGSPVLVSTANRIVGGLAHAVAEQRSRDGAQASIAAGPDTRPWFRLSTLGRTYGDVIEQIRASGAYLATGLGVLDATEGSTEIGDVAAAYARLMRSTGRTAIGSDAPAVAAGAGFHDELRQLSRQGIPSDQILRLATAGGAVALGLSLELGTLEPGRLADLVVVSGDPLARLEDLDQIEAVVIDGIWHDFGPTDRAR